MNEEEELDALEAQIPELAEAVFKQAYLDALAAGSKVLKAENGMLIEVSPDGSKRVIKELPPRIKVTKGQIIRLR